VKIALAGGKASVAVRVSDPNVGVVTKSIAVSFGDGKRATGHKLSRHRYAHGGTYEVIVKSRDKLGNRGTTRKLVRVR